MSNKKIWDIAKNILATKQFRMLENMPIDCHGTTCLAMTKTQLLRYMTPHNELKNRHCERTLVRVAIHASMTNQKDSV